MGIKRKSQKSDTKDRGEDHQDSVSGAPAGAATSSAKKMNKRQRTTASKLPFDFRYIMAPMVGASELPFRLFCRKYGAQMCYTPMMMASEFASSAKYREREFPTSVLDRPLVCHFAANKPTDFARAAQLAAPHCDAIDLNLGCPQRTAYVGHFGSYLLDPKDRQLVLDIVRAGSQAVDIPIFVKIRLLDTFEETLELVGQLYEAGATLIAVHGRYRASFHRKGPGARDGPALLDQIEKLKAAFPDKLLVTNGNTITYDDVVKNLEETKADGIMSAEGILDNPAIFLNRLQNTESVPIQGGDEDLWKMREERGKKLFRKFQKVLKVESKQRKHADDPTFQLNKKDEKRLAKKSKIISKLGALDESIVTNKNSLITATVPYKHLEERAQDNVQMAMEYLRFARHYPATMRTVIFHTRRIIKTELGTYQLMEECLGCSTIQDLETVVKKIQGYTSDPESFRFDKLKAQKDKEALERKRDEEGKRKAYEARMLRKAKREGKDVEYYLRQGAVVPTATTVKELAMLSKEDQLRLWKDREHSQHCMLFHLSGGNCHRGRGCAFLHVAPTSTNNFDEQDEIAG